MASGYKIEVHDDNDRLITEVYSDDLIKAIETAKDELRIHAKTASKAIIKGRDLVHDVTILNDFNTEIIDMSDCTISNGQVLYSVISQLEKSLDMYTHIVKDFEKEVVPLPINIKDNRAMLESIYNLMGTSCQVQATVLSMLDTLLGKIKPR